MYSAHAKVKNLLEKKWKKRLNTLHMERLSNIKSRIDTQNSQEFYSFHSKGKKGQLIEGNFT